MKIFGAKHGNVQLPCSGKTSTNPERHALLYFSTVLNCIFVLAFAALYTPDTWLPFLPYSRHSESIKVWDHEYTPGRALNNGTSPEFSWDRITPSEKFDFKACYDDFECARLEVPMDRNSSEDNDKVILAVIRIPAKVSVTDPRYGGVIFLTPGGPGVPGVQFLRNRGYALKTIIEGGRSPDALSLDIDSKFFDVISMDPRGIGRTSPALQCFPDTFSRDVWNSQRQAEGLLGDLDSNTTFETIWARFGALGQHCARGGNRTKIAKHMNTPNVVMDIVDMLERYGEWRENQAGLILNAQDFVPQERRDIIERTRWLRDHEKLQLWGFSYGTVVGATFAAMHPYRIHRLVLDGVVDAEQYYSIPQPSDIVDADMIMVKFAKYCFAAGPQKCAFYTGHSAADITTAIGTIANDLHERPLVVQTTDLQPPAIVTYSDFMATLFQALYNPYYTFPQLAAVLANLRSRDGSMVAALMRRDPSSSCPSAECKREGPFSQACVNSGAIFEEASAGVACTDGADLRNMTRDEYKEHVTAFMKQSKWMGNVWITNAMIMPCKHWQFRPAREYHGPVEGNTSSPILLVSTTYDPVCPLRDAHKMSTRFPGSVVLEQNSEGHCSFSSPSLCTAHHVSSYFRTGALPARGTVCLPDSRPFGLPGNFTAPVSAERPVQGIPMWSKANDRDETQVLLAIEDSTNGAITHWSADDKEMVQQAAEHLSKWPMPAKSWMF